MHTNVCVCNNHFTHQQSEHKNAYESLAMESLGLRGILIQLLKVYGLNDETRARIVFNVEKSSRECGGKLQGQQELDEMVNCFYVRFSPLKMALEQKTKTHIQNLKSVVSPIATIQSYIRCWNVRQHLESVSSASSKYWLSLLNSERQFVAQLVSLVTVCIFRSLLIEFQHYIEPLSLKLSQIENCQFSPLDFNQLFQPFTGILDCAKKLTKRLEGHHTVCQC